MVKLIRTDSGNQDFIGLVKYLDADLAVTDGDEQAFYDQGIILREVHIGNREKAIGSDRALQKNGYQLIPNYEQYAVIDNSLCFEKN